MSTNTRPDPANLVQVNIWLMDHMEALERARDEKRYCAADAGRLLGIEPYHFHSRPWRVPTFGLKYDGLYPLTEWRAWLERPEAERRAEWDAMSPSARKKARGMSEPVAARVSA